MEKSYRIVLDNGNKFIVKATGKETARKEALKRKELDAFGVHIEKIELVETDFKDYLKKVEAKTGFANYIKDKKNLKATSLKCVHCDQKVHVAPGENCPNCGKVCVKETNAVLTKDNHNTMAIGYGGRNKQKGVTPKGTKIHVTNQREDGSASWATDPKLGTRGKINKDEFKMNEEETVDFDYSDKKKSKLKGPFGKNTDAMSLQGRADIKQRTVTARQGDNPLVEDHETMLDRLHTILNGKGVDDEAIVGGVHFDPREAQRVAANLGVSVKELDTLIASLISHIQSDNKSRMIQEVGDTPEERYSFEADGLGSMTLRDAETGESKFLQGHEATDLATRIESAQSNPNRLQEVLQDAFLSEGSVFDFFLREFKEDSFDREIASDSGTYNMPWKLGDRSGFMTVFFTDDESGKPDLQIQSVRDTEGEEIEVHPNEEKALLDQAKAFMAKEFS